MPMPNSHRLDDITWMTVAEVAKRLRVSKMTIYRLVEQGEIPSIKVGRSFRIADYEFRAYLTERIEAGAVAS